MSSNAIIEICAFTIDAYNYARAAATLRRDIMRLFADAETVPARAEEV